MDNHDKNIQSNAKTDDAEYRIHDDAGKDLLNRITETIEEIMKTDSPSAQYRRISTYTAACESLHDIYRKIGFLSGLNVGDEFEERYLVAVSRLKAAYLGCVRVMDDIETDVREKCDPWKHENKKGDEEEEEK